MIGQDAHDGFEMDDCASDLLELGQVVGLRTEEVDVRSTERVVYADGILGVEMGPHCVDHLAPRWMRTCDRLPLARGAQAR